MLLQQSTWAISGGFWKEEKRIFDRLFVEGGENVPTYVRAEGNERSSVTCNLELTNDVRILFIYRSYSRELLVAAAPAASSQLGRSQDDGAWLQVVGDYYWMDGENEGEGGDVI